MYTSPSGEHGRSRPHDKTMALTHQHNHRSIPSYLVDGTYDGGPGGVLSHRRAGAPSAVALARRVYILDIHTHLRWRGDCLRGLGACRLAYDPDPTRYGDISTVVLVVPWSLMWVTEPPVAHRLNASSSYNDKEE